MAVAIAGLVRSAAVRSAERGIERRTRALLRFSFEVRGRKHDEKCSGKTQLRPMNRSHG